MASLKKTMNLRALLQNTFLGNRTEAKRSLKVILWTMTPRRARNSLRLLSTLSVGRTGSLTTKGKMLLMCAVSWSCR